jgi:hypothetical protein
MTKEIIFYYVLGLLQVLLFLIKFFYYRSVGFPPSFCIAKGCGLNLRVVTLAMYATMMRRTMSFFFTFEVVRPLIPMGFNIQIHSYLGFCLVLHGLGHTCGHIAFATHADTQEEGFTAGFTQPSLVRGDSYKQQQSGDAVTGYALLGLLLVITCTALLRGKGSGYYRVFFVTHFGYVLWPGLMILHVPRLWPYFVAITALLVLERAYDMIFMTLISTLSASRPCNNGVTFLSVSDYDIWHMTYSVPCCHTATLSYNYTATLPHCHTATPPHCHTNTVTLPHCHTIHCYTATTPHTTHHITHPTRHTATLPHCITAHRIFLPPRFRARRRRTRAATTASTCRQSPSPSGTPSCSPRGSFPTTSRSSWPPRGTGRASSTRWWPTWSAETVRRSWYTPHAICHMPYARPYAITSHSYPFAFPPAPLAV